MSNIFKIVNPIIYSASIACQTVKDFWKEKHDPSHKWTNVETLLNKSSARYSNIEYELLLASNTLFVNILGE